MRRTVGYFRDHKFGAQPVIDKLKEYGFKPGAYRKLIVSCGWTPDAQVEAEAADIELMDFRAIMREIDESIRGMHSYFTDDTLRTLNLFARTIDHREQLNDKD